MMEFFNQQCIWPVWQLVRATLSWPFKLIWTRISLFLKFDQLMKPLLLWHSTVSILWDSHLKLDDLLIIKLFQVTKEVMLLDWLLIRHTRFSLVVYQIISKKSRFERF